MSDGSLHEPRPESPLAGRSDWDVSDVELDPEDIRQLRDMLSDEAQVNLDRETDRESDVRGARSQSRSSRHRSRHGHDDRAYDRRQHRSIHSAPTRPVRKRRHRHHGRASNRHARHLDEDRLFSLGLAGIGLAQVVNAVWRQRHTDLSYDTSSTDSHTSSRGRPRDPLKGGALRAAVINVGRSTAGLAPFFPAQKKARRTEPQHRHTIATDYEDIPDQRPIDPSSADTFPFTNPFAPHSSTSPRDRRSSRHADHTPRESSRSIPNERPRSPTQTSTFPGHRGFPSEESPFAAPQGPLPPLPHTAREMFEAMFGHAAEKSRHHHSTSSASRTETHPHRRSRDAGTAKSRRHRRPTSLSSDGPPRRKFKRVAKSSERQAADSSEDIKALFEQYSETGDQPGVTTIDGLTLEELARMGVEVNFDVTEEESPTGPSDDQHNHAGGAHDFYGGPLREQLAHMGFGAPASDSDAQGDPDHGYVIGEVDNSGDEAIAMAIHDREVELVRQQSEVLDEDSDEEKGDDEHHEQQQSSSDNVSIDEMIPEVLEPDSTEVDSEKAIGPESTESEVRLIEPSRQASRRSSEASRDEQPGSRATSRASSADSTLSIRTSDARDATSRLTSHDYASALEVQRSVDGPDGISSDLYHQAYDLFGQLPLGAVSFSESANPGSAESAVEPTSSEKPVGTERVEPLPLREARSWPAPPLTAIFGATPVQPSGHSAAELSTRRVSATTPLVRDADHEAEALVHIKTGGSEDAPRTMAEVTLVNQDSSVARGSIKQSALSQVNKLAETEECQARDTEGDNRGYASTADSPSPSHLPSGGAEDAQSAPQIHDAHEPLDVHQPHVAHRPGPEAQPCDVFDHQHEPLRISRTSTSGSDKDWPVAARLHDSRAASEQLAHADIFASDLADRSINETLRPPVTSSPAHDNLSLHLATPHPDVTIERTLSESVSTRITSAQSPLTESLVETCVSEQHDQADIRSAPEEPVLRGRPLHRHSIPPELHIELPTPQSDMSASHFTPSGAVALDRSSTHSPQFGDWNIDPLLETSVETPDEMWERMKLQRKKKKKALKGAMSNTHSAAGSIDTSGASSPALHATNVAQVVRPPSTGAPRESSLRDRSATLSGTQSPVRVAPIVSSQSPERVHGAIPLGPPLSASANPPAQYHSAAQSIQPPNQPMQLQSPIQLPVRQHVARPDSPADSDHESHISDQLAQRFTAAGIPARDSPSDHAAPQDLMAHHLTAHPLHESLVSDTQSWASTAFTTSKLGVPGQASMSGSNPGNMHPGTITEEHDPFAESSRSGPGSPHLHAESARRGRTPESARTLHDHNASEGRQRSITPQTRPASPNEEMQSDAKRVRIDDDKADIHDDIDLEPHKSWNPILAPLRAVSPHDMTLDRSDDGSDSQRDDNPTSHRSDQDRLVSERSQSRDSWARSESRSRSRSFERLRSRSSSRNRLATRDLHHSQKHHRSHHRSRSDLRSRTPSRPSSRSNKQHSHRSVTKERAPSSQVPEVSYSEMQGRIAYLQAENERLHSAATVAVAPPLAFTEQHTEPGLRTAQAESQASDLHIENVRLHTALQQRNGQAAAQATELAEMKQEISRLLETTRNLSITNKKLLEDADKLAAEFEDEHAKTQQQLQETLRQLEAVRHQYSELTNNMQEHVRDEIERTMTSKDEELLRVRSELKAALDQVNNMSRLPTNEPSSIVVGSIKGEDYFDGACQKLFRKVQQWVLRFSKVSDNSACKLYDDFDDEKIEVKLDNAMLDGSDVDVLLADRIRRRDVFTSILVTMIWQNVFRKYMFGMDRADRQRYKAQEESLLKTASARAAGAWRVTVLTELMGTSAFQKQVELELESVTQDIMAVLSKLLPPPPNEVAKLQSALSQILRLSISLASEMRTQQASYFVLPPMMPEYDASGDLAASTLYDANTMDERSGLYTDAEALQRDKARVKMALFPLVVKKGDDFGEGADETVVYPAQVLVVGSAKRDSKTSIGGQTETAVPMQGV